MQRYILVFFAYSLTLATYSPWLDKMSVFPELNLMALSFTMAIIFSRYTVSVHFSLPLDKYSLHTECCPQIKSVLWSPSTISSSLLEYIHYFFLHGQESRYTVISQVGRNIFCSCFMLKGKVARQKTEWCILNPILIILRRSELLFAYSCKQTTLNYVWVWSPALCISGDKFHLTSIMPSLTALWL